MSVETKSPELEKLEKLSEIMGDFTKKLGEKLSKDDLKDVHEAIESLKKGSVDKGTVESIKTAFDKFQTQFEEMQEDLAIAKNRKNALRIVSPGKAFIDHISAQKMTWDNFKKDRGQRINLEVPMLVEKVAGNMETGNVDAVGSNSIPFSLADFEFGLTRVQRRSPFLMQLGNVSPINTMYAQWAEQENPDGAPTAVSEGSSKPQIDFDWVEKSQKVEKIAAFIKVSKEALADLAGLRNEIDTELSETVALKADDDLWDADGTSPNIKGITQFATAYSEPAGITTVENDYDLLRAAIAQVVENKFIPNNIVMHPTDVANLDILKDSEGRYLIPPFKSATGQMISGVPIVENLGVDQGEFLVGDFTKWKIRLREGFNIDMGLDGNDFTKNMITILGEIRLASYVKGNHTGAFVLGSLLGS
jgi:HK97 family phage major capsid protein